MKACPAWVMQHTGEYERFVWARYSIRAEINAAHKKECLMSKSSLRRNRSVFDLEDWKLCDLGLQVGLLDGDYVLQAFWRRYK